MPGFGISPFGTFSAGSSPTAAAVTSLADFNFTVNAESYGFAIKVSFDLPAAVESPDWNRNLRVMRKQGEYPQAYDDADAYLSLSRSYAASILTEDSFVDTGLSALTDYYYALYAQRNDGTWICDRFLNRGSAYPYNRWGFTDYLFKSLPQGWQRADGGDLYDFCKIIGTIFDDLKTDSEYLRSLFEIDRVHDDLLRYLDDKVGWPTWHAAGALKRRLETANAVPLCKLVGTKAGIESAIEDVSAWTATIAEGWRYVMFTNGLYNSKTPGPFPDPSFVQNAGLVTDKFKYTNDNTTTKSWHSVNGILLYLEEVPGISSGISSEMVSRYNQIIELVKPTYANVGFFLVTVHDEIVYGSSIEDSYLDLSLDVVPVPIDENFDYSTTDVTLFKSEPTGNGSLTPDTSVPPASLVYRTFHKDLSYV